MKKAIFKNEFSQSDYKTIEKRIYNFLKNRFNTTERHPDADIFLIKGAKTFKNYSDVLGLAYTSSGDFAGLFVCNECLYMDAMGVYKIEGFCMDAHGFCFAWCMDTDEREIYINI